MSAAVALVGTPLTKLSASARSLSINRRALAKA